MGTNYYLKQEGEFCPHCGHSSAEGKHIGKSSGGWCFSLHVYPSESINELEDWEKRWSLPGAVIVDEYGSRVDVKEMRDEITVRSWPVTKNDAFREGNEGPNGLRRHPNTKPGKGTYDLCDYEFC